MGSSRTDDIVSAMSEARRERFEEVVRLVGEPLRRYAARRTDAHSAEDVVADAFLVIWRRLDDVPQGGELPWCYAVARNCLANAERSTRRQHGLLTRIVRMDPPRPSEDVVPDLPDAALTTPSHFSPPTTVSCSDCGPGRTCGPPRSPSPLTPRPTQ